jgi:DNA repair photolyase
MPKFVELLELKRELRDQLERKLTQRERNEALADSHSRREPRMCGLTVHPGRGCSLGCKYCYVEDMGIRGPPESYKLSGLQLVYAILSNPFFLPSEQGTMLAFGSITEPFLPGIRERTFEYLRAVSELLGNPTQISTKFYIGKEESRILGEIDPKLSVLVTIPCLSKAEVIEPYAPRPELRFQTIRNLRDESVHTSLFLRPIIPGVADLDGPKIIENAKSAGANGVVLGTLRVTPSILERLREAGIHELEELLTSKNIKRGRQVPIDTSSIKSSLRRVALRAGLRVFPAACSANMDSHSLGCYACSFGPCFGELPPIDPEDIREGLMSLGIAADVYVKGERLILRVRGGVRREKVAKYLVRAFARRMVSTMRT